MTPSCSFPQPWPPPRPTAPPPQAPQPAARWPSWPCRLASPQHELGRGIEPPPPPLHFPPHPGRRRALGRRNRPPLAPLTPSSVPRGWGGRRRVFLPLGPSLPSILIKSPLYVPFKEKPLLFYLFSELVPPPYKQNSKYTPVPFQSNPCIPRNSNQALAISKIITKKPIYPY